MFICHTYEYVTDVLQIRTIVRIRNSLLCVWMPHEYEIFTSYKIAMKNQMCYICVQLNPYLTVTYVYKCHTSNLTRVQTIRNIHILWNGKEKSGSSLLVTQFVSYHSKWYKAWSDISFFFFFFFFYDTAHIRAYVSLQQNSIVRTKDNVNKSVPVTTLTPNTDIDWLQSPVTKYFYHNPVWLSTKIKPNKTIMTVKAGH